MLETLSRTDREELLLLLEEKDKRERQRMLFALFPEEDIQYRGEIYHSRHKYPKHTEFFKAGATYRERCFMAANRIGKTVAGGFETACHLTGWYPDWWEGRVFDRPVRWWVAGKNGETTRDILQAKLLGEVKDSVARKQLTGEGIILGDSILQNSASWKSGVPNLIDPIKIKHKSGGKSTLGFKSFHQGRGSFEGTEQDGIWLDEECPQDVYNECLIRTATTNGMVMLTFTPLEGLTETVLQFLPDMRIDDA